MAKNTTLIWASFPSRDLADQAVHRLEHAGFARNSIDLDRREDGGWNVGVHTREQNLERVRDLLHSSNRLFALNQYGGGAADTLLRSPMFWAGAAALAGIAGLALLPKNRRPTVHSMREFPGRVARGAQDVARNLPETARQAARSVQDRVGDLPGAVSDLTEAFTGGSSESGARQQGSPRR